jgi:phosphate-selective porin OprO/OprP
MTFRSAVKPPDSAIQAQFTDGPATESIGAPKPPLDPKREAIRQEIRDYIAEMEAQKQAEAERAKKEAQEKGHEVGSDLNLRAHWVEGRGLTFTTANKDWDFHFGGRLQFQPVFFNQPSSLKGPGTGPGGVPAAVRNGGLGSLDDGMYFRRIRLKVDGTAYETVEFNFEINFEQLNFITYDHMWFGAKDLPFVDTVRVGLHKTPMGMENYGSDYHLSMLERSAGSDAFSTLFGLGIWMSRNFFDNNVSFQTMFHKTQQQNFYTSSFGDGNYASSNRVTWTPLYWDEGREIIHVGFNYQWRTGNLGREIQPNGTGSAFGDSQTAMRFRARGDVRDAIGVGAGNNLGGDPSRFVDTGYFLSNNIQTIMPEFLLIWGPFSIQSEAYWVWAANARTLYAPLPVGTNVGTTMFTSCYAEMSYFLTGEHRGYDRRFGVYNRPVLDKKAFLVRDDDHKFHVNWGAWQVAYRYTYMDLNSNGINGGQLGEHSFGLNWYFNDMAKLQFQYSIIQRNVVAPAVSGTVNALGLMAQWYF